MFESISEFDDLPTKTHTHALQTSSSRNSIRKHLVGYINASAGDGLFPVIIPPLLPSSNRRGKAHQPGQAVFPSKSPWFPLRQQKIVNKKSSVNPLLSTQRFAPCSCICFTRHLELLLLCRENSEESTEPVAPCQQIYTMQCKWSTHKIVLKARSSVS